MEKTNTPSTKARVIICFYARADCGKTKSIRSLFIKLGGHKKVLAGTHDFVGDVNFGGKQIGFVSHGDPGSSQFEDLEVFAKNGYDIIVTASRTRGITFENVCKIATVYGYTVVWVSPFYFDDAAQASDELCDYFAERNADNIAQYIIDKLI